MTPDQVENLIKVLCAHVNRKLTHEAARMWAMDLYKYTYDAGMAAYRDHYRHHNTFPTLSDFEKLVKNFEPRYTHEEATIERPLEDWEFEMGLLRSHMLANYVCACGKKEHLFVRQPDGTSKCMCKATAEDRVENFQRYHDELREKARELEVEDREDWSRWAILGVRV